MRAQTPMTGETSPQLGWLTIPEPQASDARAFLSHYLSPGDAIYDLSNEPGLFYHVLGYGAGARYFTIASAYTGAGQRDVMADLTRTRPRIVVMYGTSPGALPSWDGILNEVRSYAVSAWVLDHYRLLAAVAAFLFYVDDTPAVEDPALLAPSLQEPLTTEGLPFRLLGCDWGYAPGFLDIDHPPDSAAVEPATSTTLRTITLRPPAGHAWADYHWLVLRTPAPTFAEDRFDLRDAPDVAGEVHGVTFGTLAGSQSTYRVPIGACAQWHGYGHAPLQLTHTSAQPVTVSLLP